jgi:hypothetical protein
MIGSWDFYADVEDQPRQTHRANQLIRDHEAIAMTHFIPNIGDALLISLGMAWRTGWTLVLGFTISATLQTIVPASRIRAKLGGPGVREIVLDRHSSSGLPKLAAENRGQFRAESAGNPLSPDRGEAHNGTVSREFSRIQKTFNNNYLYLAERVGFEPTIRL